MIWPQQLYLRVLVVSCLFVNGQEYSSPFFNGFTNNFNLFGPGPSGFTADNLGTVGRHTLLFSAPVSAGYAAPLYGSQLLFPSVKQQPSSCSGGQVCVNKHICRDGYFTKYLLFAPHECGSDNRVCCTYRPSKLRSVACNAGSEVCVPQKQCVQGVWKANGRAPPPYSYVAYQVSKCYAPEVCCRITDTEQTSRSDEIEPNIPTESAPDDPSDEIAIPIDPSQDSDEPHHTPILTLDRIAEIVANFRKSQPSIPVMGDPATTSPGQQSNSPSAPEINEEVVPQDIFPVGPSLRDAAFGEFPWQAMILSAANNSLLCSGIVLGTDTVLSAPSCVEGLQPKDFIIKVGVLRFGYDDGPLKVQTVRGYSIDPDPSGFVALGMDEYLKFDKHIDTIGLAFGGSDKVPTDSCITTGWGRRAVNGTILHVTPVSVVPTKECESTGSSPSNGVAFICGRPKADPCELDIGSALACRNERGGYDLKGIALSSSPCGSINPTISFARPDFACGPVLNIGKCIDQLIAEKTANAESQ